MNTWLKFGSGLATGALLWMVFPEAMLGKVGRFDPPDLQIDESPLEEPIKAATSFAPVVKSASPCVVSIQTVQERSSAAGSMDLDAFRRFFDPEGRFPMPEERDLPAQGTGSGVIVSSDGFILTNFHVVEGTQSISVVLADGTTSLDAEIVGADKHSDLAVLKVQRKGLSAITLGNSDHLEVGDVVLALGSPFGLSQSVTMGIVSATGRAQIGMMDIENFIQTDASINPGNSGG
ncbi:MAG: trypsin-like peptidase domain-containing protein, partial [Limisphaerales bacterium]